MIRTVLFSSVLLVVLCGLGKAQEPAASSSAQHPTDEKQAEPAGVAPAEAAPVEELSDVQEVHPESAWESSNYPKIDRVVNLLTTSPTRKHALLILIDHRAYAAYTQHFFRDWFGLDYGLLKIGLGLRFGILDDLDVGLYRLSNGVDAFDVYEFDARYRFLKQDRMLVNMALRAGGTWFYKANISDSSFGGFGQLMIDRVFWDMLQLGVDLLYHSSSTGGRKTAKDTDYSLAFGAYFQFRPVTFFIWSTEIAVTMAGYAESYPVISTALKFVTNRHTFSLVLSNSQYITADGVVANTYRKSKDLVIGFTITREIDF